MPIKPLKSLQSLWFFLPGLCELPASHLPRLHREVETNFHVHQKPKCGPTSSAMQTNSRTCRPLCPRAWVEPTKAFCKSSQVTEIILLWLPPHSESRKYFSFVTITGQVPRASRDLASPSSCFWFLAAHSIFVAGCL